MISELARQIDMLHREKNIPRDVVIEILESAMEAAAKKKYGMTKDIEAQYNAELGEVELIEWRTVVEEVEDEDIEITLEEARAQDPGWQVGDSYGQIVDATELGRIAAQTAKQVIIQKIRDAERELTFNEFKDRKGELITGIVRRSRSRTSSWTSTGPRRSSPAASRSRPRPIAPAIASRPTSSTSPARPASRRSC